MWFRIVDTARAVYQGTSADDSAIVDDTATVDDTAIVDVNEATVACDNTTLAHPVANGLGYPHRRPGAAAQ